jgi:F-type H+-transporting ATPase subunit epsilon
VADGLRLEVVTPLCRVLEAQVDEVELPGDLGALGVLPGHTPLLTALGIGTLTYRGRGGGGKMVVAGGFAEVLPDRVTILADLVERPEEVDAASARVARAEAEAAMKIATAEELDGLRSAMRLAETRIGVAEASRT